MSGYLFKSYCYETTEQVAASVHSSFFLDGFGIIQSVTVNNTVLNVTYLTPSQTIQNFTYSLASCEKLGFDNSFSGLSQADSIQIGQSVAGVLLAAWAIKIVKRVL